MTITKLTGALTITYITHTHNLTHGASLGSDQVVPLSKNKTTASQRRRNTAGLHQHLQRRQPAAKCTRAPPMRSVKQRKPASSSLRIGVVAICWWVPGAKWGQRPRPCRLPSLLHQPQQQGGCNRVQSLPPTHQTSSLTSTKMLSRHRQPYQISQLSSDALMDATNMIHQTMQPK